nr:hypothetical protein CE91St29_24930 [Corynebacterium striatum]
MLVATGTDVLRSLSVIVRELIWRMSEALWRVQAVGFDKRFTSETCSGSARRVTSPNPSLLRDGWGGSPLSSS